MKSMPFDDTFLHFIETLCERGKTDLALDLLVQASHHLESQEAADNSNSAALAAVREKLENKFKQVRYLKREPFYFQDWFKRFAIKTGFLLVIFGLLSMLSLGAFLSVARSGSKMLENSVKTSLRDSTLRPRLLGLLSNNPATNFKISERKEKDGDLKAAIEEMEIAVGLLAVSPNGQILYPQYAKRLEHLRQAQAASSAVSVEPSSSSP